MTTKTSSKKNTKKTQTTTDTPVSTTPFADRLSARVESMFQGLRESEVDHPDSVPNRPNIVFLAMPVSLTDDTGLLDVQTPEHQKANEIVGGNTYAGRTGRLMEGLVIPYVPGNSRVLPDETEQHAKIDTLSAYLRELPWLVAESLTQKDFMSEVLGVPGQPLYDSQITYTMAELSQVLIALHSSIVLEAAQNVLEATDGPVPQTDPFSFRPHTYTKSEYLSLKPVPAEAVEALADAIDDFRVAYNEHFASQANIGTGQELESCDDCGEAH